MDDEAKQLGDKVSIHGYIGSRLRDLVVAQADEERVPVSEYVCLLLAKAIGRPDLGKVPRKKMGRPRKIKPEDKPLRKGRSHPK